jgi:hypothetical protein
MKHNYPAVRAPRSTEYSLTYKILHEVGERELYLLWKSWGHLKTASILTDRLGIQVSYGVVQYIAQKKDWVRIVKDRNLPIYKGVLNGKVPAEFYRSFKFA